VDSGARRSSLDYIARARSTSCAQRALCAASICPYTSTFSHLSPSEPLGSPNPRQTRPPIDTVVDERPPSQSPGRTIHPRAFPSQPRAFASPLSIPQSAADDQLLPLIHSYCTPPISPTLSSSLFRLCAISPSAPAHPLFWYFNTAIFSGIQVREEDAILASASWSLRIYLGFGNESVGYTILYCRRCINRKGLERYSANIARHQDYLDIPSAFPSFHQCMMVQCSSIS
jgi:hypothetical protein